MSGTTPNLISKETWAEVGQTIKASIDSHFAQGKTPDGKPFVPYSVEYQTELQETGESTKPDNQRTGVFRGSFKVKIVKDGVVVESQGNPSQLIGWSKANEKRPVVGLGMKDIDAVVSVVLASFDKKLKDMCKNG